MEHDVRTLDRWTTRRSRLVVALRDQGVSGVWRNAKRLGLNGSVAFVREKLRYQLCSAFESAWDRRYDVNTSGQIDLEKLEVIGPNRSLGHAVVSSSPRMFTFMSRFFPKVRSDHTFIDIGCGKGRVVLLASQLGFKQTIGVEFSPLIAAVARRNLARFHRGRTALERCSIVTTDATDYELPSGALVIYLFNPFAPELAAKFFTNVIAACEGDRRPIRICLSGTMPQPVLAADDWLKRSGHFACKHRGVSPHFVDAYLPCVYSVFDVLHDRQTEAPALKTYVPSRKSCRRAGRDNRWGP
jgi:hypothetical protein